MTQFSLQDPPQETSFSFYINKYLGDLEQVFKANVEEIAGLYEEDHADEKKDNFQSIKFEQGHGGSSGNSPVHRVFQTRTPQSHQVDEPKKMDIKTESTRRELAKDPKRKASRSNDPGWKYAFYPMPEVNKDVVKCILCGNSNHGGINRFKQHLIGGYPDIVKCPKTTKDITKEINDFVQNKKKRSKKNVQNFEEDSDDDDVQEIPSTAASNTLPSSKSTAGSKGKAAAQPSNSKKPPLGSSKSVAYMLMKTPEQVVEDRHRKGASQTTLENRLRTPEEKERVHMHIANFFYECGIPFNAVNSRSYEVMVESIGQYGPGLKPPTYHELRVPLLKKAKDETEKLKEKHEKAWKRYGCTLMSDGWTDRRGRSLINFLVNSPEGTFFLGSVNASSESHDAQMLANLLESKIKEIGEKNVVQVVTDNGANYKLAGQILEIRMPTLFWTPCAAHCVDLMLEDIGKIPAFKKTINQARRCTTFIYRHGRVLDAMREKTNGRDLIRTGATRFATAFLTLDSLQKKQEPLRFLFCGSDWTMSKLSKSENGRKVFDTVLSSVFWSNVGDCVDASLPLLQVLRIADGDERPALAEIAAAIDYAKAEVKKKFGGGKMAIRNKVVKIIDDRWNIQMGKPLHGASLFLNPGRYFDLLENDPDYASRLREDFNDVLEKMVKDRDTRNKISDYADAYKNTREGFTREMTIEHRKSKSPLDWWDAYGGRAIELQVFARRIVGLCASSSGCEHTYKEEE
ncbi:uncharacterized protein LOC141715114 [Apium graveolens]|uniref:uncharacterized protein LOC141715114 n=1 Tax=Apium graveolens TaxID=4045 RepID=UPI003D79ED2B